MEEGSYGSLQSWSRSSHAFNLPSGQLSLCCTYTSAVSTWFVAQPSGGFSGEANPSMSSVALLWQVLLSTIPRISSVIPLQHVAQPKPVQLDATSAQAAWYNSSKSVVAGNPYVKHGDIPGHWAWPTSACLLRRYVNTFIRVTLFQHAVLRIQTLLIRIRILLVTLIPIRIRLFNLIRIRIRLFDPDPTVWSGSLPFQRGNVPKTVLFIHLNLIYLVSPTGPNQKSYFIKFSLPVNVVVLISVAYGSVS
jgi:hypothetical protein